MRDAPASISCFLTRKSLFGIQSIHLHFSRQCLALVTQRIKVTVYLVIANHYPHAAVQFRKRLAEDAQVCIRLRTDQFFAPIAWSFLAGYG